MERGRTEKQSRSFVSQDDAAFRDAEKRYADQAGFGKRDGSFGAQQLDSHRVT